VLLDAVERGDAGMVQGREQPRLALEAGETVGVPGERLREGLDRDLAAEAGVTGAAHLAHAAFSREREDLVARELRAR
jgi:hypothetical protein